MLAFMGTRQRFAFSHGRLEVLAELFKSLLGSHHLMPRHVNNNPAILGLIFWNVDAVGVRIRRFWRVFV